MNKLRKKSHLSAKATRIVVQKSSLVFPNSKNVNSEVFKESSYRYELIESSAKSDKIMFYIHGGAFCLGSIDTHRNMFNYLVEHSNFSIIAVEYPLSPENRYPSQIDHINDLFDLIFKKFPKKKWIIAGDSAGGNLAINLLLHLNHKSSTCESLVLLSPWVDLRDESYAVSAMVDDLSGFDSDDVAKFAKLYCSDEERHNSRVSPVLMDDFAFLPQTLIQCSRSELLYNDIKFLETKIRKSKVSLVFQEEEDLFHSWQLFPDFSKNSRDSLDEIIKYVENL